MAGIARQILSLIFGKGINTGKDPKVLQTELQELENGRLDRAGAVTKRYGTRTNHAPPDTLIAVSSSSKKLYKRDPSSGTWSLFDPQPTWTHDLGGLVIGLPDGGIICAVKSSGYPTGQEFAHYDPTSATWSYKNSPINLVGVTNMSGFCLDGTHVYAVGGGLNRVLMFDGTSWSLLPGELSGIYGARAVWAAAADDIWVVNHQDGAIAHFDGTSWTQKAAEFQSALSLTPGWWEPKSVWGSGTTVLICYETGDTAPPYNKVHVAKYVNGTWSELGTGILIQRSGSATSTASLWGTDLSHLWVLTACGSIAGTKPAVSFWNGSSWVTQKEMSSSTGGSINDERTIFGANESLIAGCPIWGSSPSEWFETVNGVAWTNIQPTWPDANLPNGMGAIPSSIYTEPFLTKHEDHPVAIGQNSLRVFDGAAAGATGNFDLVDGTIDFCDVTLDQLDIDAGLFYTRPDIIINGNIMTAVVSRFKYGTSAAVFVMSIRSFNATTKELIDSRDVTTTAGDTIYGRLSKSGTTTYVWYVDGSPARVKYRTVSSTGTIGAASEPDVALPNARLTGSSSCLDACEMGDAASSMLVTYIDTNNDVTSFFWNPDRTASQTIIGTFVRTACYQHAANKAMVVYTAGIGDIKAIAYTHNSGTEALDVAGTAATIETTSSPHQLSSSSGRASGTDKSHCFYTVEDFTSPPNQKDPAVRYAELTVTGGAVSAGTPVTVADRCRLASKLFGPSSNQTHVMVQFRAQANSGGSDDVPVPAQSVYLIINLAGRAVGKVLPGRAKGHPADAPADEQVCSAVASGSSWLLVGLQSIIRAVTPTSIDTMIVRLLTVSLGEPASLDVIESNGLLHIPNSNPYFWDGAAIVEQGFLAYPEGLKVSAATVAGSLIPISKKIGYCAVYERIDLQGNVHQSAPSPVISITLTGTDNAVVIEVPRLLSSGMTRSASGKTKVILYRTDEDQGQLYRLASIDADITPSGYGQYVTFRDRGRADQNGVERLTTSYEPLGPSYSSLQTPASYISQSGNPWLYTTPGIVENLQPQPYKHQCIHQGRFVYADAERPKTRVCYSRYLLEGEGPGLNDVFEIIVPEIGGEIMALASFQDRLVIFKEDRIYAVYGNGLSENGTGQDYSAPLLVATGHGCKTDKSLLQIPDGLVFQSQANDLILLRPDFSVDHLFGTPVRYHTSRLTLSAAALISELQYAIWTTTAGLALVYNYHLGQWSTFTNHEASDAVECNGRLYMHYGDHVRAEDRSTFLDEGASVRMKLVTGILPISEDGRLNRLFTIFLRGQNLAAHKLVCWPRYDDDPVWASDDKQNFNAQSFGSTFDVDAYHGAGLASSYADKAYEISCGTKRQKCKRVQIQIYDEDVDGSTPTNEGYSITEMKLEIGARDSWLPRHGAREMS